MGVGTGVGKSCAAICAGRAQGCVMTNDRAADSGTVAPDTRLIERRFPIAALGAESVRERGR